MPAKPFLLTRLVVSHKQLRCSKQLGVSRMAAGPLGHYEVPGCPVMFGTVRYLEIVGPAGLLRGEPRRAMADRDVVHRLETR